MKSGNARRTPLVLVWTVFFAGTQGSTVFAREVPQLVRELSGQGIPIKEVVENNDTIVAKLDYPAGDSNAAGQMMAHKDAVFRKLAEEFPESTTIRIDLYVDGAFVFPYVGETNKISAYLNETPTEIETYPEAEVDVAYPIPFPPGAGVVVTSAAAATDTVVESPTTFWRRINWPLVGVLFIFSYCTLLAVIILVIKKTRSTPIDPLETRVIESLSVLYPDGQRMTLNMPEKRLSIGRDPSNMLVLQDPHASSFHAEILVEPDGYVIKDLESTNGVTVNGRKVSEKTIHPGDVIQIGSTKITPSQPD